MPIEVMIHERFIANRWTLSLAESCTGGSLAARLTLIPGASHYFLGSVVAYSNALKTDLLHVPDALINRYGAVSSEVVSAMLDGILSLTRSSYAIAVSGIAGPTGGTAAKPVGTLWGGIGKQDGLRHLFTWQASGHRAQIISSSVDRLLEELLQISKKELKGRTL
jgi:nicotinamide-nucleotide amidase